MRIPYLSSKEQFIDYTEVQSGTVKLGDNQACSIGGIGTVSIHFGDGCNINLKHLRHVAQIKRNLISMAMLDQEGFNVKIENGVVMVFTRILVCNERED